MPPGIAEPVLPSASPTDFIHSGSAATAVDEIAAANASAAIREREVMMVLFLCKFHKFEFSISRYGALLLRADGNARLLDCRQVIASRAHIGPPGPVPTVPRKSWSSRHRAGSWPSAGCAFQRCGQGVPDLPAPEHLPYCTLVTLRHGSTLEGSVAAPARRSLFSALQHLSPYGRRRHGRHHNSNASCNRRLPAV